MRGGEAPSLLNSPLQPKDKPIKTMRLAAEGSGVRLSPFNKTLAVNEKITRSFSLSPSTAGRFFNGFSALS
jgi:hypothetical protein